MPSIEGIVAACLKGGTDRWIEAFNQRPLAERDRLLGGPKPRDTGQS